MLEVSVVGMKEADDMIKKVMDMLEDKKSEFALDALHSVAKKFDENFVSEGKMVGGWDELAESTVRDRERLGVPGTSPILVRYEDLRDFTATNLMAVGSRATMRTVDAQGGSLSVNVVSNAYGVIVSASGTKALHQVGTKNMPVRQYWFVNEKIMSAAKRGGVDSIRKHIKRII